MPDLSTGMSDPLFSSRARIPLEGDLASSIAFRVVLGTLADAAARNVAGTIANANPEHLHQLRVAVRRARSILAASSDVLEEEVTDPLRVGLRWLGHVTGPARDLDVWVRDWDALVRDVPDDRRPSMPPLHRHIVERQIEAHRELEQQLASPELPRAMNRWTEIAEHQDRGQTRALALADSPISEVGPRRVRKSLRRVLRDGGSIVDDSPAAALHDLRKRAKRLRYQVECFRSVLDPASVSQLIRGLKPLQNVLGRFQDCEAQSATLTGFAHELGEASPAAIDTLLAIGALTARLDARQAIARGRFAERFASFERTADAHPIGPPAARVP